MNSNKSTLVLISILLLVIAVSYPFIKKNQTAVTPETGAGIGQAASVLLSEIQSIQLNFGILEDESFLNLKDRTLPPLNLPKGKKNPFAPGV